MPVPALPSGIWQLLLDAPVVQDATYAFNAQDRAYLDSQIRGIETHILQSLLLGQHCTWFTLDGGSAAASTGDAVCSAGSALGTVTRALAAAIAAAGGAVGVVILGGPPGGKVLVALKGLLPSSVTGLPAGTAVATVNTATARLQAAAGSYPIGTIDAAGTLTLTTGLSSAIVSAAGATKINLFPYVDTLGTVYISGATANGPGFSLTEAGVAFTPWVVGSIITGMRFVWVKPPGGPFNVLCNLWGVGGGLASATVVNPSTGIVTATFNSPYTVQTADLGGTSMVLSTFCPGSTGAYWTQVDFTDLILPALPIMASPLWRYIANQGGGGPTNTQAYSAVFGLTGTATNNTTPIRPSSSSTSYVAMEPVFQ